jgi:hypothetical protein
MDAEYFLIEKLLHNARVDVLIENVEILTGHVLA